MIGTPRMEKDLQLVVDAVAACGRDDIQLVIRVDLSVAVPDDPRIIAEHGHLEDAKYLRRMKAYDAVILPFSPTGMLTPEALDRSRQALIDRRPAFDWEPIAEQTLAVLEAAALRYA